MDALIYLETRAGLLRIAGAGDEICEITFCRGHSYKQKMIKESPVVREAATQLRFYFRTHQPFRFCLPLKKTGSDFAIKVRHLLSDEVPFGSLCSYGELARRAGVGGAARAVGHVMAQNPYVIVVPCHRVIRADGSIGGFSGGLQIKKILLAHEQICASR